MQRREISKAYAAVAVIAMSFFSQSAAAVEVAPYFESWARGTLVDAKKNAGLDSATLAFGITRGACAFEAGFLERLPDARNYAAAGGRLLLSLGGADGVYVEVACRDDHQLYALLEKLIIDSGTRRLDFDVEGHQLSNTEATARRARVLARLQAKYPDLYLAFTLPGWLRGLNPDSINLLKTTVAAGARIDMVNVMTQSFGVDNIRTMVVPATVGQASVTSFQATAQQLSLIFPGKTPAQLHAMMGITPMIGTNDDGSTFTLDDAQTVADFAKLNGVGLLAYWSFQRDKAQTRSGITPLNMYSGVAQSEHQFHNIFKSAIGYIPPVQPPAAAPVPVPTPPPTLGCGASVWVVGKNYAVGSIVSYGGQQYRAKFANPGYNPTISTYFWAPYVCTVIAAPVKPLTPVASPSCSAYPGWVEGRPYAAGNVVAYPDGKRYVAKFANPGYNPTISTYYWSRHAC